MRFWPGKKATQTTPASAPDSAVVIKKPAKKKAKKTGKLKVAAPVRRRFEDYLDKRNRKCWGWKGSRTSDGYGQFWLNDFKVVKAHRFAYEIYVRKLSPKERLRNICSGKSCINPACWEVSVTGRRAR